MTDSRWNLARIRRDRTLRRESDMIAFTACIALLAALSYGDDDVAHSKLDVLVVVWGTIFGLTLTQWFALTLSVRLVHDPSVTYSSAEMLLAQLMMAVLVTVAASTVVLAVAPEFDRLGARITAAVFLGALVGVESRAGGASLRRSLVFASGALAVGVAIATVKWAITT